jgi:hypothetical protein
MAKQGKRYSANAKKVDPQKRYGIAESFDLLKELASAKFDETVDVAIRLGVDPKKWARKDICNCHPPTQYLLYIVAQVEAVNAKRQTHAITTYRSR